MHLPQTQLRSRGWLAHISSHTVAAAAAVVVVVVVAACGTGS